MNGIFIAPEENQRESKRIFEGIHLDSRDNGLKGKWNIVTFFLIFESKPFYPYFFYSFFLIYKVADSLAQMWLDLGFKDLNLSLLFGLSVADSLALK